MMAGHTVTLSFVAQGGVSEVFCYRCQRLRFADTTVYLLDGSHYLPHDEFLGTGLEFWFGAMGS